jgi:hypothetical protein
VREFLLDKLLIWVYSGGKSNKKEEVMKQQLKVRLEQDVITGFSYSFTKALLGKLKQLKKEGRIFRDFEGKEESDSMYSLTQIADSVLKHIDAQLGESSIYGGSCAATPDKVQQMIQTTEEFLAIFNEKGETIAVPRKELERILDTVALAEGKARGLIHSAEAVKLLEKAHTKIDELLKD